VPLASSFTVDIFVFGDALLSTITINYISFQYESLNILGDKLLIDGISPVGCEYTAVGCPGISNNVFSTINSGFTTYYSSGFFVGFNWYLSGTGGSG
jgi:hypothetical protein